MRMSIQSLGGSIKDYESLLGDKISYEEHYHVYRDEIIKDGYGKDVRILCDGLKDVFIPSIESLTYIFEDFNEKYGYGGQITMDVHNKIVYILDTWIE